MNLFPPLGSGTPAGTEGQGVPEIRRLLDGIPALIDKTFPLPGRFRAALPGDVAELSRLLTSARGERGLSYLGRPNLLSAYLRYFLPWNLYRLCRLLPPLPLSFVAHNIIVDLGCGPLAFAAALWISRPDLRGAPLEFRCIDRSGPALDAGKQFFAALTGGSACPWKIQIVKADFFAGAGKGAAGRDRAALVCAVNVFNEIYGNAPHRAVGLNGAADFQRIAEKSAALLAGLAAEQASILVVEPGVPQSGQFISLLRNALLERGRRPLAPCTHCGVCPLPGSAPAGRPGKSRWCHFAFETAGAPKALRKLSAAAGIPKERAVLSFLLTGSAAAANTPQTTAVRVISDAFPLPGGRLGCYGCSGQGLVLLAGPLRKAQGGEQTTAAALSSGSLINAAITGPERRDPKSGALIIDLPDNADFELKVRGLKSDFSLNCFHRTCLSHPNRGFERSSVYPSHTSKQG
jgi:hypothetical protein